MGRERDNDKAEVQDDSNPTALSRPLRGDCPSVPGTSELSLSKQWDALLRLPTLRPSTEHMKVNQ